MDCSTPGFPVHHQLLELAQTHVHQDGDAIQPFHPLSSLSLPAFNLSQHQFFSSESVLHIRWPKYCSFSFSISPSNEYSGLISLRIDWFDLLRELYAMLCYAMLSHFSRVQLCETPEMAAHQAPPSLGFSRQEHWSGLPFPSPMHESEK